MADKKLTPAEEIEQLKAQLKERDDQVKALKVESKQEGGMDFNIEDQTPFKAVWKGLDGAKKATVRVGIPAVRLKDDESSVVSSTALLKVAAGKELSEAELKDSPALDGFSKEEAATLINSWCKVGASFLKEVK